MICLQAGAIRPALSPYFGRFCPQLIEPHRSFLYFPTSPAKPMIPIDRRVAGPLTAVFSQNWNVHPSKSRIIQSGRLENDHGKHIQNRTPADGDDVAAALYWPLFWGPKRDDSCPHFR